MKNNEVILHGECMVFRSSIPSDAKKITHIIQNRLIVAPSETTGNHHYVEVNEFTEAFQSPNGTLFIKNTKPTNIKCVIDSRHSTIPLPPGTYEFGSQQEYDPFTARMNKVRD